MAKLTPGIIIIGIILGTAIGPLTTLKDLANHPELLVQGSYWQFVGAQTISSFAAAALAGIGIAGAALGLPMWQQRKAGTDVADPP